LKSRFGYQTEVYIFALVRDIVMETKVSN